MEFLYVVAPLPSWQHRDSCVVNAFAIKFCPAFAPPLSGTVHFGTVLYPFVIIGESGGVPLRENVPGIFLLPCASGHQLVHGPKSKCS